MIYDVEDTIRYSIDRVALVFRDRLPDLAAHLPHIEQIEPISRKEEGDLLYAVNRWTAKAVLPPALHKIVKVDQIHWIDDGIWHLKENRVTYKLSFSILENLAWVNGETALSDNGDGSTKVRYSGHVVLNTEGLSATPNLLAKSLGTQLAKFLMTLVKPGLIETGRGVELLLEAEEHR